MAKIRRVYGIGQPFEDVFPIPVTSTSAPTSSDTGFNLGQVWVRTATDQAYILTSVVAGVATWALAAPGASDVDTLTGDSGGAISPAVGNIILAGGTNITSAGAGNTITFNLDAAVVIATSVTVPLITAAAAADFQITGPTGQDVIVKMGDNAGANKVSFLDSDDAEVASIDSNGGITSTALTFTGLLTASASATIETAGAALNLGSDNDAGAVNLGVGTTARAIGIGDSAAAHTITVGSVSGAASLDLLAGTGNFTLEGNVATTYGISATGVNTGTITIGGGTGAQQFDLMNSTGIKTVNLANGTSGNTVSLLNGVNTVAQTLNVASGANAANSTVNVLAGVATAGTQTLNLATGASASAVNIGNVTGATAVAINAGTGNFALEGNVATTYAISNTGVNTGQVDLAGGTGARTINLGGGGTGAKTINIGAAASADLITIGDATGAGSLDLVAGTGNFTLEGNVATTYGISATGVNTGTITIGGGTGAQTTNIATGGTGVKTVNIGTGAIDNVVTVGSTTGAASLILQSGTGRTTMTGTVKTVTAEHLVWSGDDVTFQTSPSISSGANTGAAAAGTTGAVNIISCQQGLVLEQFVLGAGQTIIKPVMDANGLLVSGDLTATEGFEYNYGAARTNSRNAFTIGSSAAFSLEVELYLADISGGLPYGIGFRKSEANNATFANYTDYVLIGMFDTTSSTNVVILDELNGTGQTATDTTDAWGGDAASQTLKILVSAAGVVTFEVGGSAAGVAPAYTFDNGDVVVPFLYVLHGAAAPGAVNLVSWKCGFQA